MALYNKTITKVIPTIAASKQTAAFANETYYLTGMKLKILEALKLTV